MCSGLKSAREKRFYAVTLLLIMFFRGANYIGLEYPVMFSDSEDYISLEWDYLRTHFVTNTGQPPLYPLLIAICRVFGTHYLNVVVGIQMLLSLSALFAFAYVLRMLELKLHLRMVLLLFYGASPAICGWDGCILTESLSLSGTVWFVFFIMRYIKAGEAKNGIASIIITLLLTFLRPQFLYVFAALLFFFVLKSFFEETNGRTNLKMVFLMLAGVMVILAYCNNFKSSYGIFSLSDALPRQNLFTCMERGYYKEFENKNLTKMLEPYVEDGKAEWNGALLAVKEFGSAEISRQTRQFFQKKPVRYLKDTIDVIAEDMSSDFYGYDYGAKARDSVPGIVYKIIALQKALFGKVSVGWALLASSLEGIAMTYVWLTKKRPPWVHMALFSISVCTTWLTYFVTCGEYMRTMVSVLPYFYIMIGLFIQWACNESLPESERNKNYDLR